MCLGFIRFSQFLQYWEHPRGGSTGHDGEVREPAETRERTWQDTRDSMWARANDPPNQRAIGPATPRQTGGARQEDHIFSPRSQKRATSRSRRHGSRQGGFYGATCTIIKLMKSTAAGSVVRQGRVWLGVSHLARTRDAK